MHLAQQARVELALREGTRLVVECSFIVDCSAREVGLPAGQSPENAWRELWHDCGQTPHSHLYSTLRQLNPRARALRADAQPGKAAAAVRGRQQAHRPACKPDAHIIQRCGDGLPGSYLS